MRFKATLIIPTMNKSHRLKLTLLSLLIQKIDFACQVIIVDDGSTDETSAVCREFILEGQWKDKFDVRYVQSARGGRSSARNMGLGLAEGDIVIYCDDDTILHPDFLQAHVFAHEQERMSVIHGTIYNLPFLKFFNNPETGEMMEGQPARKGLGKYTIQPESILVDRTILEKGKRLTAFERNLHQLIENTSIRDRHVRWVCCTGGNVSIEREHLLKVGGFDEQMGMSWGAEDLELGYRLMKYGMCFDWNPDAINYHMDHYRSNHEELHRRAFHYFMQKHQDPAIKLLLDYFEGRVPSLLAWLNAI